MEEGSSTPPNLLLNQQKLSQERARIQQSITTALSSMQPAAETLVLPHLVNDQKLVEQDQEQTGMQDESSLIEQERSRPTNERTAVPGQFSELKPVSKSDEKTAARENLRFAAQILPVPARNSALSATSGKRWSLFIGSGVLICLLALGGMELFWRIQPSPGTSPTPSRPHTLAETATLQTTAVPTPTPSMVPTATPTKNAKPLEVSPSASLSFEDGSTGGWQSSSQDGTIESIDNVATSRANDGRHVLEVSFDSDDDNSYPCVGTSYLPAPLKAGETISVSLLKRKGSRVQATLYVVDQRGKWSTASTSTLLESTNTWYRAAFHVPSTLKGPATQVGVIFFGDDAVVYLDALRW